VIISTGSKALQDQLYSRDLPTVAKALKFTGKLALLKGRSNYLCLERLEQQALAGGDLPVQTLSDVILLRSWSNQTQDGDISTCASVAEDSRPGRWSPAPTITVSAATARCIKIASW
jgi:ATP-dependent DNA helicase DinG